MSRIVLEKKNNSFGISCVEYQNKVYEIGFSIPSAKVRIDYSGICGSDIHAIHMGESCNASKFPRILGHEACGTILKIFEGEHDASVPFKEGVTVVINPIISCGKCEECKAGKTNLCLNRKLLGFDLDGLMQENVIIPIDNLIILPSSVEKILGALTEPLAVAVHSVMIAKDFGLKSGQNILLFGAGKISLFISLVLKKLYKPIDITIIGLDKDAEVRFPILQENGIHTYTFDQVFMENGEIKNSKYTERKFPIVFEVSGSESGMKGALNSVKNGGVIIAVGLAESDVKIDTSILVRRELKLVGSDGYVKEDLENAISLLSEGIVSKEWVSIFDPRKCIDAFLNYENSKAMAILFKF
ncbi:MAG: alcohol dehydrogenase catalytic domain-containing protein [Candidatus Parvarchaeota archaeon]